MEANNDVYSLHVKTERVDCADDDSCVLEAESAVKEEMDIGPVELQRVDMYYNLLPVKCETAEDQPTVGSHSQAELSLDIMTVGPNVNAENTLIRENKLHVCCTCSESFKNKRLLSTHMKIHKKLMVRRSRRIRTVKKIPHGIETAATTVETQAAVTSNENLVQEIKTCHFPETNMTNNTLEATQRSEVNNEYVRKEKFACDVCRKVFNWKSSLITHLLTHKSKPKIYIKNVSHDIKEGTTNSTECVVNRIASNNSAKISFECSVCGKNITSRWYLNVHMKTHTGEKSFECTVCGKMFARSDNVRVHMRIHTGEKPFECSVCGKKITKRYQLNVHMKTHTGEKPFECSVCGKQFTECGTLAVHMRIHTGDKPFECSVCGKKFTVRCSLKAHVRIHTGDKPYECSVCGNKFTERGTLAVHLRIHTGDKPFECSVCGKKFSERCSLKAHVRIHTGEKPFECSICGNQFTERGTLAVHVRIHTGDKPFGCSVCGKKFTTHSQLKVHMRIHTVEKPYECSVCGKKFIQCGQLKVHARTHRRNPLSVLSALKSSLKVI